MQYLVNISIDDVTPHPRSSISVVNQCNDIISEFPEAKFTLFIPVSYWRTVKPGISTKYPLQIDLYKDFCDSLNELPKDNFEIGYHGLYHGIPGKSDNDEMRHLNAEECKKLLETMFEITRRAGVKFKPILRPPAWRMSPACFDVCEEMGIKILALSPDKYPDGSLDYGEMDKSFKSVVYYNVCPPFKPLALFEKTEIVYHACDWDSNYLNAEKANNLKQLLREKKDSIKFCFMDEMI